MFVRGDSFRVFYQRPELQRLAERRSGAAEISQATSLAPPHGVTKADEQVKCANCGNRTGSPGPRPALSLMAENHAVEQRADDFFLFRIEPGDGFELQLQLVVGA